MATLPAGFLKTDEIFEVEKIVDSEVRDGQYLYRVRWKGCPREEDTWEPEANLLTCDALLKSFKEDQENKRRKRRLKRIERRREFFRKNATPLHIKVKDECANTSDIDDDEKDEYDRTCNNDRVSAEKKTKSALASPSSDFEDFDLSGLTRKQRQDVQKMIEESKRDADLVSPSSSTTEENEHHKDDEGTSSKCIVPHKRKKIGRRAVIDESSDSDDSDDEARDLGSSTCTNVNEGKESAVHNSDKEHDIHVENNNTSDKNVSNDNNEHMMEGGAKERYEHYTYKGDNNESNDMEDGVAKDKGKKASEILDTIFNSPTKVTNSPLKKTLPSSLSNVAKSPPTSNISKVPFKTFVDSSTSKITSSPIRINISDDSNDESGGDKETLKRRRDVDIGYIPLFDQLQKRMDPLMSSLDLNDKLLSPKRPFRAECYNTTNTNTTSSNNNSSNDSNNNNDNNNDNDKKNNSNENNNIINNTSKKCTTNSTNSINNSNSTNSINNSNSIDNSNSSTTTTTATANISNNSSTTATSDTFSSNIDNNKNNNNSVNNNNTLSENTSTNQRKSTELNLCANDTNITSPTQSLLTVIPSSSTLKVDTGKGKRTYMKGVENIRNTLAMKRMLINPKIIETTVIDQGYSNRDLKSNGGTSSGEISAESFKQPTPKQLSPITKNKSPIAETIESKMNSLADRFKRAVEDGSHLQRVHKVISSIDISCDKNMAEVEDEDVHFNTDSQKDTSQKHAYTKTCNIDPVNTSPIYIQNSTNNNNSSSNNSANSNISTNNNNNKGTIANKNDLRSSDSKVFDPRTHANIVSNKIHKHIQKMNRNDKLNVKYKNIKSKKLSLKEYNLKKASKLQAPPIIEFTKLPPKLQRSVSTPEKVSIAAVENVAATPPTTPPAKHVLERRASEKKEKGPKLSQLATNTDVLGNIMECFRQPLGRDSTLKSDAEQESPQKTRNLKGVAAEVTDSDIEAELDDYSGDEDGMLRGSAESSPRPSHLNLPHANTKFMELLAIYQAMMREDLDTLIRVKIPAEKINLYVDHHDTLIMKAVVMGSTIAAQILLEKNADPNVLSKLGPRNGKSPLMVATEMNLKSMVLLLVQHNARMNMQTQNGETALILASKLGHMEVIHALLNCGADVKPAATYLEKKVPGVPVHLLLELQSTLHHHTQKLKQITETFLKDLLSARNTKLGQQLMPLRCVSPDEMDEHEFYFKCTVNAVEPHVNVLMLALPVIFKRNGGVDVKYAANDNGIKSVYLNDGQMFPIAPGSTMSYFLFPKCGEINTLRIQSGGTCKYKLLLCVYSVTYKERVEKTHRSMLIQAASAPVPVH